MKPVVRYRVSNFPIQAGQSALIQTYDHPSPHVTNLPASDCCARTSTVLFVRDNGEFETRNTIYRPLE